MGAQHVMARGLYAARPVRELDPVARRRIRQAVLAAYRELHADAGSWSCAAAPGTGPARAGGG